MWTSGGLAALLRHVEAGRDRGWGGARRPEAQTRQQPPPTHLWSPTAPPSLRAQPFRELVIAPGERRARRHVCGLPAALQPRLALLDRRGVHRPQTQLPRKRNYRCVRRQRPSGALRPCCEADTAGTFFRAPPRSLRADRADSTADLQFDGPMGLRRPQGVIAAPAAVGWRVVGSQPPLSLASYSGSLFCCEHHSAMR